MDLNDLKRVIEALIFAADAPLTPERIRETLEACSDEEIAQVVAVLNGEYEGAGHSFMIRQVAGGYQVTTRPEYGNWIKKLYLGRQKGRLSHAALESLAIIAFKQPISRVDIAQIRGVNSDAVIGTLLERKLVTISGRSEAVGRPLLYSTTPEFLEFFGINDLAELPKPREIEELIGKEGMPEEVLQALSSDKQLKLPISFELEPGVETSAKPFSMPVAPEPAETVNLKESSHTLATENAAFPVAASEEETSELGESAVAAFEADAGASEAALVSEAVDENAEMPVAFESQDEPVHIVSQDEASEFIAQDTLSGESPATPMETAPSPSEAEIEVVLPTKKAKERKRGKRAAVLADEVDGRAEVVTPQAESVIYVAATSHENLAAEDTSTSTVAVVHEERSARSEDSTDASIAEALPTTEPPEQQAAPENGALPLDEIELDAVGIADEELASAADEPWHFVSTVASEADEAATSDQENFMNAAPSAIASRAVFAEPRIVDIEESRAVTKAESSTFATRFSFNEDKQLAAAQPLALSEEDGLEELAEVATASEAPMIAAPETQSDDDPISLDEEIEAAAVSSDSAFEIQPEPVWASAPVVLEAAARSDEDFEGEQTEKDKPSIVAASAEESAKDLELDTWPEVTEVRLDETLDFAEAVPLLNLSEQKAEPVPVAIVAAAQNEIASDEDLNEVAFVDVPETASTFAPKELRAEAELEMLLEPVIVKSAEPSPTIMATPAHDENMHGVAIGAETRGDDAAFAEDSGFFV